MWLMKLRIAISILCWLCIRCMIVLFKERYDRYKRTKKAPIWKKILMYICPVMNVIFAGAVIYMAFAPDEFVEMINREE